MRHYHQAAIESSNGVQLIVALYDGLQRFLTQAAVACEVRDEPARREAARRALNIVIHLQASLRMDVGGASAERLSDFYTSVFADVLRASASASRQLFLDTAREVRNVREASRVAADDPTVFAMIPLDLQTRQEQLMNTVQTSNTVAIRSSTKTTTQPRRGSPEKSSKVSSSAKRGICSFLRKPRHQT
jgi:flagellar secretion chaperone FliS